MKAYLKEANRVLFTPVEDLTENDREVVKLILDRGLVPLSDWYDPVKKITWPERLNELREWMNRAKGR